MESAVISDFESFEELLRKNKPKAYQFYRSAGTDFATSKSEYKNKRYNVAIFHLQQCVEKVQKALLAHLGLVDLDKIKTHNPNELFLPKNKTFTDAIHVVFSEGEKYEAINNLFAGNGISLTGLDTALQTHRLTLQNKKNDTSEYDISKETVDEYLSLLHKLEQDMDKRIFAIRFICSVNQDEVSGKILSSLIGGGISLLNVSDEMKSNVINNSSVDCGACFVKKDVVIQYLTLTKYLLILQILNEILYPHSAISRYPDKDFDPNTYYSEKLPLVTALPELLKFTNNALKDCKKICDDIMHGE